MSQNPFKKIIDQYYEERRKYREALKNKDTTPEELEAQRQKALYYMYMITSMYGITGHDIFTEDK